MPGIIAFPTIVEEAVDEFGWIFANTPECWHFAEYLTGLMVAERKNVSAINAEFAQTTDQSCLNRWITQVPWDVDQLNEHRLAWLQGHSSTRYSARGVMAIDNTLVDHSGEMIEDVGWFRDHADRRHLIAHDYVIANYVCSSGKHYPLEFRRFRKRAACAEDEPASPFKNHTHLFKELIDWAVEREIPGDFAFDSYFSSAESLNHIQGHKRGYVGDLKSNRKVWSKGREMKAAEWAAGIASDDRQRVDIGDRKQWYVTRTVRLPHVDHPVRLVILWDRKNGKKPVKYLVTNRVYWEISRILNVYRKRWTGTETFHRDGKQHLGMGDGQLRSAKGQTRHLYPVMLAHSLLIARMRQSRACGWAHSVLTTVGQACRAVSRETLSKTIHWAVEQATTPGWNQQRIVTYLELA